MEQGNCESHTLPQDEHHNQEKNLRGQSKPTEVGTGVKVQSTKLGTDAVKMCVRAHR